MALDLFNYQAEGAEWLSKRTRSGLFDDMGLGKTATVQRAIDLNGLRRGIVIGPAILRHNFIAEYHKFGLQSLRWCKGCKIEDFIAWKRGAFDVLVTSFDQATNWWPKFKEEPQVLDFLIIDEAHNLKSPDTNRAKAVLGTSLDGKSGWANWAMFSYWLTGTPVPNDPKDIWTFLRFAGVMPLSFRQFQRQFFHVRPTTHGERCTIKDEHIPVLRQLIGNNSIRRYQSDVGLQLPPIMLTSVLVDGDAKAVMDLVRAHPGLEDAIIQAIEDGGLSFIDAQYVSTLRRLIGEAKVIPYAHMVLDELRAGNKKRVVFGVHNDVLGYLHRFLNRNNIPSVMTVGSTPEAHRQRNITTFRDDPDIRCYIANIKSGGTGTTLTAACDLDVLESAWTPADNAQALKRVHRIGQTNTVRGRFITLANTLDEAVIRVVSEKTAEIAAVEGVAMIATPED